MKHDRTDPCAQCPFKRGALVGWLGSYTPELIIEHIQREFPFPCHITVDYEDPDWRATIYAEKSKAQACAGYLILMRKMAKLPRDSETLEHCQRLDRQHPDVFDNHFQFLQHHSRKAP